MEHRRMPKVRSRMRVDYMILATETVLRRSMFCDRPAGGLGGAPLAEHTTHGISRVR